MKHTYDDAGTSVEILECVKGEQNLRPLMYFQAFCQLKTRTMVNEKMGKNKIIRVQDISIAVTSEGVEDYICITDMAAAKGGESRAADVVKNWIRNRVTLEFLGTWEQMYNSDFKVVEFDHFRSEEGVHTFVLSVSEWIEKTNAKGMYVKRDAMEVRLHIKISHLSLLPQSVWYLSFN